MELRSMDIGDVVSKNGMEYAKAVILDRAIPSIDGFKPSQRRVLYTMKKMGLTHKKKAKCARIAGQVLAYHPHGDNTAYMTMVGMTDSRGAYSIPYVDGKGSFGKVYSRDLEASKPRYPEAGLADISDELFDGMTEGASNMVSNFDATEIEPELLPVKFPTLLVNPISGIAVGKSCNIPAFSLTNVCMATAGVAAGTIKTPKQLADVIGCPEYTTGGIIHYDKHTMEELCKTGKGKIVISSTVDIYSDRIDVTEIPYSTTVEQIVDEIKTLIKEGKVNEVSRVHNGISKDGMQIKIFIKRGYDSRDVLNKLYRMTTLRDSISYRIKVIYNNECKDDIGVLDVLNMWLEYRHGCIINQHKFKLGKLEEKEHKLSTWELIKDRVREVGAEIPKQTQEELEKWLNKQFGLDDIQIDYLLSMQARAITVDNMQKNLGALVDIRQDIVDCKDVIEKKEVRTKLIIDDMQRISAKYGKEARSKAGGPLVETNTDERKISDELVTVKYTKNGYIKRLITLNDTINFKCPYGDRVLRTVQAKNNEYLLVFTYDGEMYKVLIDDIDASRGGLKQTLVDMLKLESTDKIMWIDNSGDYSGHFNLVYPKGKGERVYYSKAAGKRMKYISMFTPTVPGSAWVTKEDKFFLVTRKRHASYVDLTNMGILSSARVFRAATLKTGDTVLGLQPLNKVPDISKINIDRYRKPYTVSIGCDVLWDNSEQKKLKEEVDRQIMEQKELDKQKEERKKMKELDKLLSSIVSDDDVDYYE